jgi:hypothetical protein
VIIISGRAVGVNEIQRKASYFGIPVIAVENEEDLERWGRGQIIYA